MNKVVALFIISTLSVGAVFAQKKLSAADVPGPVTAAFQSKFPAVKKVHWELENTREYEAEFRLNGEHMSANFDASGSWLETETEMAVSALPEAVQKALREKYTTYKMNEASRIEHVQKGTCFEVEVEQGENTYDVLFAADGTVISQTKTEEEKNDHY